MPDILDMFDSYPTISGYDDIEQDVIDYLQEEAGNNIEILIDLGADYV